MKILGIIPARYESARFPGKPLVVIAGKPMIQHVYEQCKKTATLTDIIVATDNQLIYDTVIGFNGNAMTTDKNHLNGTLRCAEVIENKNKKYDYIINIQGDEPLIDPRQIDELATLFYDKMVEIATQVKVETDLSLLGNKNIVKAILDEHNFAVDFKRIISDEKILKNIYNSGFFYKHIGIYGFKTDVLKKIAHLAPTKNEIEHHLEQLRWIDNGFKIKAGITKHESISVDTKEDLEKVMTLISRKDAM